MRGSPVGMQEITLFYEPGVRRAFPDGLVDAKNEFAEWLDRRRMGEKTFTTRDEKLIFLDMGNGSFSVRFANH